MPTFWLSPGDAESLIEGRSEHRGVRVALLGLTQHQLLKGAPQFGYKNDFLLLHIDLETFS